MSATAKSVAADVPNWYDGPVTMWAIVDCNGHPFAFDSARVAADTMERWEKSLPKFAPYRMIKLVEQREA